MFKMVINSEFFHDSSEWSLLESKLLPDLLKRRPRLNAWSAGCSSGKEPYSLAIMLADLSPTGEHSVLATDNDETQLALARNGGPFSPRDVANVEDEAQAAYFDTTGDAYFVKPDIIERVQFQLHDVARDDCPRGMDIILYRNVAPFFGPEQRLDILDRLQRSLEPGGLLFVGNTDVVPEPDRLGLEPVSRMIYRKGGLRDV